MPVSTWAQQHTFVNFVMFNFCSLLSVALEEMLIQICGTFWGCRLWCCIGLYSILRCILSSTLLVNGKINSLQHTRSYLFQGWYVTLYFNKCSWFKCPHPVVQLYYMIIYYMMTLSWGLQWPIGVVWCLCKDKCKDKSLFFVKMLYLYLHILRSLW